MKNELEKFGQQTSWKLDQVNFANYSVVTSSLLAVVFAFFYTPGMMLLIGFSYYLVVFVIASQIKSKSYTCLILDGVYAFVGILLYAILNAFLKTEFEFLVSLIPVFLISITSIFHYFLKKSKQ